MRPIGLVLVTALATSVATSIVWMTTPGLRPVAEAPAPQATIALSPRAGKPPNQPAPPQADAAPAALPAIAPVGVTTKTGDVPQELIDRRLTLPVPGVKKESLHPAFYDERGERGHEAIDIMAARGDPVVAVEDGVIAKLFTSVRGGLTIYQFDPGRTYAYYYAHLDHYAEGLKEGAPVTRGQVIGYVGSTGNADAGAPHLHFAIFLLGPEKQWWKGEPLDPYPVLTAP